MAPRHFIDTNILLYSISTAPAESEKRLRAIDILDLEGGALSVQVLQEFYVQATRPTRTDPLSHETATALLETWTRFSIQDVTMSIFIGALEIKQRHGLSYWDSAILAAARALGCRTLYSEDLAHGRHVDGVDVVNPFR